MRNKIKLWSFDVYTSKLLLVFVLLTYFNSFMISIKTTNQKYQIPIWKNYSVEE